MAMIRDIYFIGKIKSINNQKIPTKITVNIWKRSLNINVSLVLFVYSREID
jgi:hypothetical protein